MDWKGKILDACQYVRKRFHQTPSCGLILGSGLGDFADQIKDPLNLTFEEIPHFAESTVTGHHGELVLGNHKGKVVVAMRGRFHYYEGYSMQEVTFPVRVMNRLGVETMIITNACGGLNPDFHAGLLMIIEDHINLMGDNPLIGPNMDSFGVRFPDMTEAYDKEFRELAIEIARDLAIEVQTGVHSVISGPNYLSGAELTMVRRMGADTIGMSTIPETIVARHCGMRVLGISCITDMAIPGQLEPLSHEQVMKVASQTKPKFIELVSAFVNRY